MKIQVPFLLVLFLLDLYTLLKDELTLAKNYYKEGKKDGKWTWYDTYGNLVKNEIY